mgnify:CR=1 FL=1
MASKKEILKNITNYSPEEIADAVRNGVVTLYELGKDTEGAFTPLLKKRVKELLEQAPKPIEANNKEEISDTENSDISTSPTEVSSTPDELEIINIEEDSSSPIQVEPQVAQTNVETKPGMFRNPFSFTGRIRRTEYGLSIIICFFINLFMQGIVSVAAESDAASAFLILYLIMSLIVGLYGHKEPNDVMIEEIQVGIRSSHSMVYGCYLQKVKLVLMSMVIVLNNHS